MGLSKGPAGETTPDKATGNYTFQPYIYLPPFFSLLKTKTLGITVKKGDTRSHLCHVPAPWMGNIKTSSCLLPHQGYS